ncbi:hypothetical protein N7494_000271 [Penicillium frequentans]|uniref:Uncharacterized protein n=1 Tax=Penicillium frequentans TaxID=3151616 RepID=A0AAD6D5P7_9EURO|nr:hypothetical protein N7494_000271 [Penicillium glabrum]
MAPTGRVSLAASIAEWNQAANNDHPQGIPHPRTIRWHGASHISRSDYWTLRVIWPATTDPKNRLSDESMTQFGLLQHRDSAVGWLNAFPPFQKYLESVHNRVQTSAWSIGQSEEAANGLGIMELANRNQEVVISAKADNAMDELDEEVVLSSLMGLLQGITIRNPDVKCNWSNQRKAFWHDFSSNSRLSVKVDGWLLSPTRHVKALIEAKNKKRSSQETQVCRQEAAEVLAFIISKDPNANDPIFVISQDGVEIYLIVAVFDRRYVDYMKGRQSSLPSGSFMQMHKFGPWPINKATELDNFAKVALTIAIRGSQ